MKCHFRIALVIPIFVMAAACQPPDSAPWLGDSECAIINGEPDTTPEHMGVVFLNMQNNTGAWMCSGTLITPTVVLTAAHCVTDGESEICDPGDFTVYFGNSIGSMTERTVAEVHRHPDYFDGPPYPNDLGMLVLSLAAPESATPIPHLPPLLKVNEADVGGTVEFVGFGQDENGDVGTKLRIDGTIAAICDSDGCPAGMNSYTMCYQQTDGGICFGDSGGPALIVREDNEYVAGVSSTVSGSCNHIGCSTKVDGFSTFINDLVGTTKLHGEECDKSSQCYSGYCVEGVCCENACDDPCMTCASDKTEGRCTIAPDGTACPDNDPCNGSETCQSGDCISDSIVPDCTPAVPCVTGACVTGQGCVNTPVADGTSCDNGDLCDGDDHCVDGECVSKGNDLQCDDDNSCTADSCNATQGCINAPVEDGTACADDDKCNGAETCQDGTCTSGEALDCDDENACTTDSCDPQSGCSHETLPDGEKCGDGRTCEAGLCLPGGSGGCSTTGHPEAGIFFLALIGLAAYRRRFSKGDDS